MSGMRPSPLRARRVLRGLRLRDVENATGIADTMLSALERGEAKLLGPRLRRLAAFYATPAARLVDEMRAWAARNDGRRLPDGGTIVPPGSAA
jgi:transcriptional regulator with XRE-family HTH domain